MTENKAQKRAVRARMSKTGERYTAARRNVVKPEKTDAGTSEAAMHEATGKGFKTWLRILDDWGAKQRTHTEIARYLREEHGVASWWSQSVAVGYERARGMRAKYQTTSGFQVSVSKTFPFGARKLFSMFADARRRNRWLERGTLKVRTTQKDKTARFDFHDGSRVHVYFVPKDRSKTTVSIQHEHLSGSKAAEEMRGIWKERLTQLAELLES